MEPLLLGGYICQGSTKPGARQRMDLVEGQGARTSSPTLTQLWGRQPAGGPAPPLPYHPSFRYKNPDKSGWQTQPGSTLPLLKRVTLPAGTKCQEDEFLSLLLPIVTVGQGCLSSQNGQWVTGRDPSWSQGCLPCLAAPLLQLSDEFQQVHL